MSKFQSYYNEVVKNDSEDRLKEMISSQKLDCNHITIRNSFIELSKAWDKFTKFEKQGIVIIDNSLNPQDDDFLNVDLLHELMNSVILSPETKTFVVTCNENLQVVSSEIYDNIGIDEASSISSNNKKIVMFLDRLGIWLLINGCTFNSVQLKNAYEGLLKNKSKDISNYQELFNDFYASEIHHDPLKRFFISSSDLPKSSKHLLERFPKIFVNKPEEKIQLDLLKFLRQNASGAILREVYNWDNERYDIWGYSSNNRVYVFEIKWLGVSIQTDNASINDNYNKTDRILDGIYQLRDYIDSADKYYSVFDNMRIDIGVLVVYDGMNESLTFNYEEHVQGYPNIDWLHYRVGEDKTSASEIYKKVIKKQRRGA